MKGLINKVKTFIIYFFELWLNLSKMKKWKFKIYFITKEVKKYFLISNSYLVIFYEENSFGDIFSLQQGSNWTNKVSINT